MTGPGPKPELVIPMRFDGAEALKMLEKLQQAGKGSGDALDDAASKAKTLGDRVADVLSTQGYAMLKDGAAALAQGYKETADYIKTVSQEYVALRDVLQQVAALTGKNNSGDFTVQQARAAESASLLPQEWVKFQESFQSVAGAYVGGPDGKMTDDQAGEYQMRLAQFAKARGISSDEAADLGGAILQFSDKAVSPDQAMAQFGRAFKTLERSRTNVSQLLPQMTRVMAQGATSDQAAQLLLLMSEGMPGEEETGVTNVLKAIDKSLTEGKGAEIGVTDAMDPLTKAKSAALALKKRIAGGEREIDLADAYFSDIREKRGIRTLMNRGVDAGGFDRAAGYVAGTADDFTDQAIDDYQKSDQGRYARERAGLARARVERGDVYKEVEQARLTAEKQLTQEGRFESYGFQDLARQALSLVPLMAVPDQRTQLVNERALRNERSRARAMGGTPYGGAGDDDPFLGLGMSQIGANESILDAIRAQNEMMARDARKPLSAPPANPVTRPQ